MNIISSPEAINLLGRLCLAAFLGGLIGLERDIHGRAAGLRTQMLVCLGASLFMILSKIVASSRGVDVITDPGRIAAQIVTGIGFLGAGAIMKEGLSIRGLTTAACFWIVAAIGMAVGIGEYFLAVITTLIAIASLSALHHVDKFYKRDSYRILTVKLPIDVDIETVIKTIKRKGVTIIFVDFDRDYQTNVNTLKLSLRLFHRGSTDKISQDIVLALENINIPIKQLSWTHGQMY